jgi:hypothetical protein
MSPKSSVLPFRPKRLTLGPRRPDQPSAERQAPWPPATEAMRAFVRAQARAAARAMFEEEQRLLAAGPHVEAACK